MSGPEQWFLRPVSSADERFAMKPELTIPNIRKLDTHRSDLFAFEVTGHITAGDIENIYGLLNEAYATHPKIDLLVRMTNYEGWDWDVVTREATMVGKTKALKHIRRYAVVGGPDWVAAMIRFFDPFFGVEMRHFTKAEEDAAWAWLDEPAAD
jgi:hypothetical protein